MRVDLYKFVHKAQRYHLFNLSIKIGKMDVNDSLQYTQLKSELQGMINHLKEHMEHEETFIHSYYQPFKEKLALLDSQHETLEPLLRKLEKSLADEPELLYSLFNQFVAVYLQHIDEEEQLQKEILWTNYSDEALAEIMIKFTQSLSKEQFAEGMEFTLPSLSVNEVINMITNSKDLISENHWLKIMSVLAQCFSKQEMDTIYKHCFI
ncbi:hemerythrin domain-containing protein [Legionella sp.]|uniref:hemerythrin domain-containing protein n=1 Tax=Legionella sp. TaxID=459 RepID=UPI00322041F7